MALREASQEQTERPPAPVESHLHLTDRTPDAPVVPSCAQEACHSSVLQVASNPKRVNTLCRPRRNGPSRVGMPLLPLRLRVTRMMAEKIDIAAAAAGLTGAAWLRAIVADRLTMNSQADRQPVARYNVNSPDLAALTALRLQLRQTGGLITHGAKAARLAGIPTHPNLETALADIKHAITVISEWKHNLMPHVTGSAQEVNEE